MIHDITRPVHPNMVIYPNNPPVSFKRVQEASPTTNALTQLTLGTHTGTHIDAPAHIHSGGQGADSYPLEAMIGPCEVIDLSSVASVISASDLPPTSAERILIKTKNSQGNRDEFDPNFVALNESAAEELVKRNIKLVGLDALSIKKRGVQDKVHAILLDAGIVVLEGVWLSDIAAGVYELSCLPLAVQGLDGAPVRAILRPLDK